MKSRPCRSRKNCSVLLTTFCAALCLLVPAGCSGGTDQVEAAPSEAEMERDQLKSENKDLQMELDKTSADLKDMETRLKKLEDALGALQEAQATAPEAEVPEAEVPEAVPTTIDIAPPERSPSELLLGEWFNQEFHEEGEWSWTQNLIFNADGSGTICQTYYIPKTVAENPDDLKLVDADMSDSFSWSLNGDTLHLDIGNGESVDFTYSSEQQQFAAGPYIYGREMPTGLDQYVERRLYAYDFEGEKTLRMRKFLGTWYYDVLVWSFNDDGTGILDIPASGGQPAETREFTYSVSGSGADITSLILDWQGPDGGTWYCSPTFNTDGSIYLSFPSGSDMKLTRTFDPDNCPITAQIISTGIGVFSGSIFSDMLSGYSGN